MASKTAGVRRLTPVLVVESVEPCIAFWTDRLGFSTGHKVPGPEGRLVFASVSNGDVEVMYQTKASVVADRPEAAAELEGDSTALFMTVEDLDVVERAVAGAPVVKARHTTFYGSTEIYVREPGGHILGFAQMG